MKLVPGTNLSALFTNSYRSKILKMGSGTFFLSLSLPLLHRQRQIRIRPPAAGKPQADKNPNLPKSQMPNYILDCCNEPELSCGDVRPVPRRLYARQLSPFP
jgi:hypothetical protein